MCAICGILNKDKSEVSLESLRASAQTMRHRGPDDEGFKTLGHVGLGFQRLSIIDLSGGHQPMSNEDDNLWIVFNGEIYNFQELRQELEATGRHRFKTNSDTEIILHLYEDMGERCVEKLRGMFAFAIWDRKNETLFLARDRFGKKPLMYANLPNAFLFGSEIRSLLKHPAVSKDIDYSAIDLYLTYQYIPSPRTVFKSIRKLPPAHTLTYKKGAVEIKRYWAPSFQPKTTLSFSEGQDLMWEKLKESVRLRMISEVPLGAFLSGGQDSSVVVGLMSELSSRPIKTFSIGFEEQGFSELPYAKKVAEHFKCDHHEFVVKADMVDTLPLLARHYGEPFADPSALPSYYVSKMTRQHVTVALNGDGGDETLAGYPRYQAMKFMRTLQLVPLPLRRLLFGIGKSMFAGVPPRTLGWRIKRLLSLGMQDESSAYLDTLRFFREEEKVGLYSSFMKTQVAGFSPPEYINDILRQAASLEGVDRFMYTDQLSYLPECLMVKMDIASMANSLESRSPFLDHEFAECVGRLPVEWKLKGLSQTKFILKDKIKGWLPETIRRRGKQGFSLPMGAWFRGSAKGYISDMLLSSKAMSRNLFQREAVARLIEEHQSGKIDRSYQLWALLMLEHWYQACSD